MTQRKATPSLKNTYSQSKRVFEDIQKILRDHAAKSVTLDYDATQRVSAISFSLEIGGQILHFRMPARYENVEKIFSRQKGRRLTDVERDQAYRTAWANLRDWIGAQFALIETDMVETVEVFLPYMLNQAGETYFQTLKQQHFLLESKTRIIEE